MVGGGGLVLETEIPSRGSIATNISGEFRRVQDRWVSGSQSGRNGRVTSRSWYVYT